MIYAHNFFEFLAWNYKVSNSIVWKCVILRRLQVVVERPPVLEVAKQPQRRRRAQNIRAKEPKWAPLPAPDQLWGGIGWQEVDWKEAWKRYSKMRQKLLDYIRLEIV